MQALKGDMLFCSLLYPYCCCCSVTKSCLILCNTVNWGTPGFPVLHHLLEFAQTRVHWVGDAINHLIPCCPLLPLPSIFPSIRVFSSESAIRIRWLKYWSLSFSISPSSEYSRLISFRTKWFHLLTIQGTLKRIETLYFSQSVQLLMCVRLFATPWTAARQASLSINPQSLLKLISIESVMPSNHLILCRPLLHLPSIFARIRVFSKESVLRIPWPKYWSFSISPSNAHPGLICFMMDWLDLLAVQGTLKSLLQHHSSKASALSFPYSPTLTSIHHYWKNHSLD